MWSKKSLFIILTVLTGCSGGVSEKQGTDPGQAGPLSDSAPGIELVEQVDDYGYTEKIHRRIADGVRQGDYQRFNPEGVMVEEARYTDGSPDGKRIMFHSNGDTLLVETYANGAFEGAYRQYYENGILQLQGQFVNNMATGEWRQYYDSGELMEIVTFAENAENGPFSEYFRNGNLKAEGTYLNGDNEHGELKLYNEQGVLVRKMDCDEGVCRTVWSAEKTVQE